ncbi:hypothetical protein MRX96_021697 [Rhipicephalus microplus]
MERHLEVCYDLPIECRFCNQKISKKDKKEHVDNCQRDFEKRSKEPKKDEVAKTIDGQPRPQPSHSVNAAYQGASCNSLRASGGSHDPKNVSFCAKLGRMISAAFCCCCSDPKRGGCH